MLSFLLVTEHAVKCLENVFLKGVKYGGNIATGCAIHTKLKRGMRLCEVESVLNQLINLADYDKHCSSFSSPLSFHMHASHTNTAVEIPNSGSASLKEEKSATADIAEAKR